MVGRVPQGVYGVPTFSVGAGARCAPFWAITPLSPPKQTLTDKYRSAFLDGLWMVADG